MYIAKHHLKIVVIKMPSLYFLEAAVVYEYAI